MFLLGLFRALLHHGLLTGHDLLESLLVFGFKSPSALSSFEFVSLTPSTKVRSSKQTFTEILNQLEILGLRKTFERVTVCDVCRSIAEDKSVIGEIMFVRYCPILSIEEYIILNQSNV